MIKNFIITNFEKLNFKNYSNLFFYDNLLYNLYEKNNLKKHNSKYIKIFKIYNKNYNFKYYRKKLNYYLKSLSVNLNKIHNRKYSIKTWGLQIEYFVSVLLNLIFLNIINSKEKKILKKNIKSNDIYFIGKEDSNNYFYDTAEFVDSIEEPSSATIFYLRKRIIEDHLNKNKIRYFRKKSHQKEEQNYKRNYFYNLKIFFKEKILFNLIQLFVIIFKPCVLLDAYAGSKISFKILLKSRFKLMLLPSKIFFKKDNFKLKKNEILRKQLLIKEKDYVDKLFNIFLFDFFPASFLENFQINFQQMNIYKKSIKVIGSAICLISNDLYKILASLILRNKGKLITFDHGGFLHQENNIKINDFIEKKYSNKIYHLNNKRGLGLNFLTKLDEKKNNSIKSKNILLVQTYLSSQPLYTNGDILVEKNMYNSNLLFKFYPLLDDKLKKITNVKMFPNNDKNTKEKWIRLFNNKKNIFEERYLFNKEVINKNKLFVLDDISTPLVEFLHLDAPFIIIIKKKDLNFYNKLNKKYLLKLNKKNLIFFSHIDAAKFINKNIENIQRWWGDIILNRNFINFKKNLFPVNKNFSKEIIKEFKELNYI